MVRLRISARVEGFHSTGTRISIGSAFPSGSATGKSRSLDRCGLSLYPSFPRVVCAVGRKTTAPVKATRIRRGTAPCGDATTGGGPGQTEFVRVLRDREATRDGLGPCALRWFRLPPVPWSPRLSLQVVVAKPFPRPEGSDTIPIACRPAVQFNPFYPAGPLPRSRGCTTRGPPDKSLFVGQSIRSSVYFLGEAIT